MVFVGVFVVLRRAHCEARRCFHGRATVEGLDARGTWPLFTHELCRPCLARVEPGVAARRVVSHACERAAATAFVWRKGSASAGSTRPARPSVHLLHAPLARHASPQRRCSSCTNRCLSRIRAKPGGDHTQACESQALTSMRVREQAYASIDNEWYARANRELQAVAMVSLCLSSGRDLHGKIKARLPPAKASDQKARICEVTACRSYQRTRAAAAGDACAAGGLRRRAAVEIEPPAGLARDLKPFVCHEQSCSAPAWQASRARWAPPRQASLRPTAMQSVLPLCSIRRAGSSRRYDR